MKKIIGIFILVLSLFSCSSFKKETLFLGYNLDGYIKHLKEENTLINDNFTMQKGYISYLYSMIIKDGMDMINNKKLSSVIKNASSIYIQIGNDDFLRCVIKEDNKYIVDNEILNNQKELFSYYYFLILDEIREIYDGKIIVISPYFSLINKYENISIIDEALNEFYEVFLEASSYFNCEYIDIREINNLLLEDNKLNENIFSYLDNLICYGN